jgi:hypothetical protein
MTHTHVTTPVWRARAAAWDNVWTTVVEKRLHGRKARWGGRTQEGKYSAARKGSMASGNNPRRSVHFKDSKGRRKDGGSLDDDMDDEEQDDRQTVRSSWQRNTQSQTTRQDNRSFMRRSTWENEDNETRIAIRLSLDEAQTQANAAPKDADLELQQNKEKFKAGMLVTTYNITTVIEEKNYDVFMLCGATRPDICDYVTQEDNKRWFTDAVTPIHKETIDASSEQSAIDNSLNRMSGRLRTSSSTAPRIIQLNVATSVPVQEKIYVLSNHKYIEYKLCGFVMTTTTTFIFSKQMQEDPIWYIYDTKARTIQTHITGADDTGTLQSLHASVMAVRNKHEHCSVTTTLYIRTDYIQMCAQELAKVGTDKKRSMCSQCTENHFDGIHTICLTNPKESPLLQIKDLMPSAHQMVILSPYRDNANSLAPKLTNETGHSCHYHSVLQMLAPAYRKANKLKRLQSPYQETHTTIELWTKVYTSSSANHAADRLKQHIGLADNDHGEDVSDTCKTILNAICPLFDDDMLDVDNKWLESMFVIKTPEQTHNYWHVHYGDRPAIYTLSAQQFQNINDSDAFLVVEHAGGVVGPQLHFPETLFVRNKYCGYKRYALASFLLQPPTQGHFIAVVKADQSDTWVIVDGASVYAGATVHGRYRQFDSYTAMAEGVIYKYVYGKLPVALYISGMKCEYYGHPQNPRTGATKSPSDLSPGGSAQNAIVLDDTRSPGSARKQSGSAPPAAAASSGMSGQQRQPDLVPQPNTDRTSASSAAGQQSGSATTQMANSKHMEFVLRTVRDSTGSGQATSYPGTDVSSNTQRLPIVNHVAQSDFTCMMYIYSDKKELPRSLLSVADKQSVFIGNVPPKVMIDCKGRLLVIDYRHDDNTQLYPISLLVKNSFYNIGRIMVFTAGQTVDPTEYTILTSAKFTNGYHTHDPRLTVLDNNAYVDHMLTPNIVGLLADAPRQCDPKSISYRISYTASEVPHKSAWDTLIAGIKRTVDDMHHVLCDIPTSAPVHAIWTDSDNVDILLHIQMMPPTSRNIPNFRQLITSIGNTLAQQSQQHVIILYGYSQPTDTHRDIIDNMAPNACWYSTDLRMIGTTVEHLIRDQLSTRKGP